MKSTLILSRSFLSALFLLMLLLAGCGRQSQPTAPPQPTQTIPTEAPAPRPETPPPPVETPTPSAAETRILYVASALADCMGVTAQKCLLVKEDPQGDYQLFYGQIEGFAYEEGYEYQILVEITPVERPAADQSNLHYALIEVMSKTPTAETIGAASKEETPLEGTRWRLTDYVNIDGEMVAAVAESVTRFEDGSMLGDAGCIPYSATYQVDGQKMTIEPDPMIMKACEDEATNEQQAAFMAALPRVAIYSITDGELELGDAEGKVLLRFTIAETSLLTGVKWQVAGYDNGQNAVVSPLEGTELTAIFGQDGMLAGSAGCNRYAAAYKTEGEAITISGIATTRKLCPEPEGVMEQEMAYLMALQRVAAYRVQGEELELRDEEGALIATFIAAPLESLRFEHQVLANLTYQNEYAPSGQARLSDGQYSEEIEPGSAAKVRVMLTDHIAFGQLNGEPAAAVVLASSPGGSGTFYDLALVMNQDGKPANVATTLLGDRVRIEEIGIEDDLIVVTLVAHGPDDPLCCPTQEVLRLYELSNGELNLVSEEVIGQAEFTPTLIDLTAHPWKWIQTTFADGGLMTLKYPERYQIAFAEDGTVQIRSDCNEGDGVFALDAGSLSIDASLKTHKSCPRGSKTREFVEQLKRAGTTVMMADNLIINLQADGGAMIFEPVVTEE